MTHPPDLRDALRPIQDRGWGIVLEVSSQRGVVPATLYAGGIPQPPVDADSAVEAVRAAWAAWEVGE